MMISARQIGGTCVSLLTSGRFSFCPYSRRRTEQSMDETWHLYTYLVVSETATWVNHSHHFVLVNL